MKLIKKLLRATWQKPPPLAEVFVHILPDDRKRLMAWVKLAMKIDGHVSGAERALFDQLVALNEQAEKAMQTEPLGYARTLIEVVSSFFACGSDEVLYASSIVSLTGSSI